MCGFSPDDINLRLRSGAGPVSPVVGFAPTPYAHKNPTRLTTHGPTHNVMPGRHTLRSVAHVAQTLHQSTLKRCLNGCSFPFSPSPTAAAHMEFADRAISVCGTGRRALLIMSLVELSIGLLAVGYSDSLRGGTSGHEAAVRNAARSVRTIYQIATTAAGLGFLMLYLDLRHRARGYSPFTDPNSHRNNMIPFTNPRRRCPAAYIKCNQGIRKWYAWMCFFLYLVTFLELVIYWGPLYEKAKDAGKTLSFVLVYGFFVVCCPIVAAISLTRYWVTQALVRADVLANQTAPHAAQDGDAPSGPFYVNNALHQIDGDAATLTQAPDAEECSVTQSKVV